MDLDTKHAVLFWIMILLMALFICIIIFLIRWGIKNKISRYLLRLLMLIIIGIPISLMIFNIFVATLRKLHLSQSVDSDYKLYFFVINIFGILGYIIYRIVLHILNKNSKNNIFSYILDVNILFNLLIIICDIIGIA